MFSPGGAWEGLGGPEKLFFSQLGSMTFQRDKSRSSFLLRTGTQLRKHAKKNWANIQPPLPNVNERFILNKLFLRDKSGSPEQAQLILQSQRMTGMWFILSGARTLAQLASTYFCY